MIDSFTILLRRSWNQYKNYWGVLALLHIATTIFGKSVENFSENTLGVDFRGALLLFIATALIAAFATSYTLVLFTKEDRPSKALRGTTEIFLQLLSILIILSLLFSVPFTLARVFIHFRSFAVGVGIFSIGILVVVSFFPRLFAAPVVLIHERTGILESLKKSYRYSKGLWWNILLRCIFILCALLAPIAAFVAIDFLWSQAFGHPVKSVVFGTFMTFFVVYSFIAPYLIQAFLVQLAFSIIREGNK